MIEAAAFFAFGLPLIYFLHRMYENKKSEQSELKRIQKRLAEIERNKNKSKNEEE